MLILLRLFFTAEETRQVYIVFLSKSYLQSPNQRTECENINSIQKSFWKNHTFLKPTQKPRIIYHFAMSKSQSCFLFLAEQIVKKHFFVLSSSLFFTYD